jgi:hypothetical protein
MTFWRSVARVAGKVLGAVGGGVRTFGSSGLKAVRTLGSVAAPLSFGINALGTMTGREDIAQKVNTGLKIATSGTTQSVLSGLATAGTGMQNVAARLS